MAVPRPYHILVISDYRSVNAARPEAEIFIRLAARGHQVTILSYHDAAYYNQRFRDHGIRVIENHPTRKLSPGYIRYLRKCIQEHAFDVVHAFNSHGLTNAVWAMRGLRTKLIAYRGYAGQTHWYDPMMYTKYFHPRVDHIMCLSDEIRDILSRNMMSRYRKLTTTHKGHDPEWYKNISATSRSEFGFSDQDVIFSFVANLRPFKGLPYLLEALQMLPSGLPLRLVLIGNGFDVTEIEEKISQNQYRERIHRLGYRKDSQSVVKMADAFVLSSTHGEALTKSLIEAMSLGVAPIATDIPGNQGLIEDGVSGWIVPPANPIALSIAISDCMQDKEKRKARGIAAQHRIATQFHIDRTVETILDMYRRLLA